MSPAVQKDINLLHASVLSMVEFDEDIFAAGRFNFYFLLLYVCIFQLLTSIVLILIKWMMVSEDVKYITNLFRSLFR